MKSEKLPAVLHAPNTSDSLSMERSLKQIKTLLELVPEGDDALEDKLNASMDDLNTMLAAIDHN